MQKAYSRINWENYPSDNTPINETNLNSIDTAVDELDNRIITLETVKATKAEVATLVQSVEFEESTGIFKITKKNGSVLKIDTKLEKIAVNFSYDSTTQQIILTLIDGTKQYINLSALITQFEFVDTETIGFDITPDGKVKATVLDGSITEDKLQPNFLADIKVEVAKAQESEKTAETFAKDSENFANKSKQYAIGESDSSKHYYEQTKKISESLSGVLKPMGTVAFANLPPLSSASEGDMYNISNQFTTTSSFEEGEGNIIPAGSNIFKTINGLWDILGGIPVVGVKGNAESDYRRGNVNITPANIGLGNVNNTADKDKAVKSAKTVTEEVNIPNGVRINKDGEGGNITIYPPSDNSVGNKYWQIDAYNGNIRFYALDANGKVKTPLTITASVDGTGGNFGGNSATATKLTTARTIQTNLSSTSAKSFDGSGNITPGVTGTLGIGNGGTGATTAAAARSNLGLGNVNNTADADKSVKSATTATEVKGDKVKIWSDNEGGNIQLISPNGQKWEIDAIRNTKLRIFTYGSETNGNTVKSITIDENGNIAANAFEGTTYWNGISDKPSSYPPSSHTHSNDNLIPNGCAFGKNKADGYGWADFYYNGVQKGSIYGRIDDGKPAMHIRTGVTGGSDQGVGYIVLEAQSGVSTTGNVNVANKLMLKADGEGGNVRFTAKNGADHWEMDANGNNYFRLYHGDASTECDKTFTFNASTGKIGTPNGNVSVEGHTHGSHATELISGTTWYKRICADNYTKEMSARVQQVPYTFTNTYGNMYFANFTITVPNFMSYFASINITPWATTGSGALYAVITSFTATSISGYLMSPVAETKTFSLIVHITGY